MLADAAAGAGDRDHHVFYSTVHRGGTLPKMTAMFTGIVQRIARVAAISDGTGFVRLNLAMQFDDVKLGESIAVNGVCLTVAEITPPTIGFDVIPETLDKTNLGLLKAGDEVNIERSLRAGDRIDGHFVQGHVDGVAKLVDQTTGEKEWRLAVHPPAELMKFVAPKGSVAIDGVSLTVASITAKGFEVALIPTTLRITTLATRPIGWPFNLEADVLSKTIVSYLERQQSQE
jgi:riboflavin synthase